MKAALFLLSLLAAFAAQAQEADRDLDGHYRCSGPDGLALREIGDGTMRAGVDLSYVGDVDKAVYPAGAARLFAPQPELEPYVIVRYSFLVGPDGSPRSRPQPVSIGVSTGRFAGARLEPIESLALQLRAAALTSPPIEISSAYYNIAAVGGALGPVGSPAPYDTEMPLSDFVRLVAAIETGERWILLSQHGREVARIPVPPVPIAEKRDAAIAWLRKTAPLLARGRCG